VRNNPIIYKDPTGHIFGLENLFSLDGFGAVDWKNGNAGGDKKGSNDSKNNEIANKLDKSKDATNTRGAANKDQVLKSLTKQGDYYVSKIGDTDIVFDKKMGDPTNSIKNMDNKSLGVLGDMAKENKLTAMTISSLSRPDTPGKGRDQYPHSSGLGIDITDVSDKKDHGWKEPHYGIAQDRGSNQKSEPALVKKVTDWLNNDSRVSQVLTPWNMNGKPNNWREPLPANATQQQVQRKNLEIQHNSHIHMTVKP
jgi:hypothetical protein